MPRKFIPFLMILVLIPALFLTSCKKAAPDIDVSALQPEDEIVVMQEEALDNTEEADTETEPTETVGDTGTESGQDTDEPQEETTTGQEDTSGQGQSENVVETSEPTPETTPEPVETPQPVTLSPGKHVVRAGETLFRIAVTYGTTVEAISQANSITNPSLIHPGQELIIPSGTSGGIPSSPPPATGGTVYIVKPGDNLFRIGLRFGYDQYYLARYNGIENVSMIYVGQEIRIP